MATMAVCLLPANLAFPFSPSDAHMVKLFNLMSITLCRLIDPVALFPITYKEFGER